MVSLACYITAMLAKAIELDLRGAGEVIAHPLGRPHVELEPLRCNS